MFLVLLLDLFPSVSAKGMKVKIYKVTFGGWELICLNQTSLPSLALVCFSEVGSGPVLLILRSVRNDILNQLKYSRSRGMGRERDACLNADPRFLWYRDE